jgi:general secretion pathway protein K
MVRFGAPSTVPAARQRGIALISVLLITAILIGLTTQILSSQHLVIQQNQNTFELSQALQYVLGAEELTRQVLYDDAVNSGPGVDHLDEFWAQPLLPLDLDGIGVMQAYVLDLNRCFNLNWLADDTNNHQYRRLQRLLAHLMLSPDLADLIKDWVDSDEQVTGLGAEDSSYQLRTPPYYAANQPMQDLSELNMLIDVDPIEVQTLSNHVCTVPDTKSKINVNTAAAETLYSLDNAISLQDAQAIAQASRNYQSVADFVQNHPEFAVVQQRLSVTSEYFLLVAEARLNRSRVSLTSVLYRDTSNGRITLRYRDFGKRFGNGTNS